MHIAFRVTGSGRKALVAAISEILGEPMNYLGAPTFSYTVGNYSIDKEGTLVGDGSVSGEAYSELLKALNERGFIGEVIDRGDLEEAAESDGRIYRAELSDPDCPERMEVFRADDDENALRQASQYAVGGVVLLELHELDENYDVVRSVDIAPSPDRLVIEMPREGFTDTTIANLEKLIASKAGLIRKAVDTDDLTVHVDEDRLRFPWFPSAEAEEVNAYTQFIGALCATAKAKKRVLGKERPSDNEKFDFRTFLVRLGLVGDEYKAARKILMRNLDGNSAFKHGRPIKADANEN